MPILVEQFISNPRLVVHSFIIAKQSHKMLSVRHRLKNHAQRLHYAILHRIISTPSPFSSFSTSTSDPEFERRPSRRGTSIDLHSPRVRARPPRKPPRSHRTSCSLASIPHPSVQPRTFPMNETMVPVTCSKSKCTLHRTHRSTPTTTTASP